MKMKKESRPLKKNKDSTLAETKNNNGRLRMLKGSVRDPRSYSLPREKNENVPCQHISEAANPKTLFSGLFCGAAATTTTSVGCSSTCVCSDDYRSLGFCRQVPPPRGGGGGGGRIRTAELKGPQKDDIIENRKEAKRSLCCATCFPSTKKRRKASRSTLASASSPLMPVFRVVKESAGLETSCHNDAPSASMSVY